MTDQPSRVTPADLAELLDRLTPVPPDAPAAERLAYLHFKAGLLSRLAAELGSAEGYRLSAAAWEQARDLLCDNSPVGGGVMKMSRYSGEQLAQVDNPDPFAPPVWRSPVYHTPG